MKLEKKIFLIFLCYHFGFVLFLHSKGIKNLNLNRKLTNKSKIPGNKTYGPA